MNAKKNSETNTYLPTIQLLVQHGKRKGYLTQREIADCIPDSVFDNDLLDLILSELATAEITYIDEEGLELPSDSEPEPEGDEQDQTETSPFVDSEMADLNDIDIDDSVRLYLREATDMPLLTAEDEVTLAKRIELGALAHQELTQGKVSQDRAGKLRRAIEDARNAREHMIRANSRLVISVAKKYTGRGLPLLDLIQEGNIGLMRAVSHFEHQRGFRFSTYATWWIRQGITRALADQGRTIRLPVHLSDQVLRLQREQTRLQQELGRAANVDEISQALEMSPQKVQQLQSIIRQPISLQTPLGNDSEEVLGEVVEDVSTPNPEEIVEQEMISEDLRNKVDTLPPREREVLQLRYGLSGSDPMTLQEIGQVMGITRERARQLEVQALNRLRNPKFNRDLRSQAGIE